MQRRSKAERDIIKELRDAYGPDVPIFVGRHLARYHDPGVPYHVLFKTFQSRFLVHPDKKGHLGPLLAGILSRGLRRYRGMRLMSVRVLSNHVHMMIQGPTNEIPQFIGHFKRETNIRWAKRFGWTGTMWEAYASTALPTHEAQVKCLKYIESNGVKEGLITRPEQWPGLNCTRALLTGQPNKGVWFNGTGYGDEVRRERKRVRPSPVRRVDFFDDCELELTPIPAWQDLEASEQCERAAAMVEEIVEEGRVARKGRAPLGVKAIVRQRRNQRGRVEPPPWWEDRVPMVAWDNPSKPDVLAYLREFWEFQFRFRLASTRFLAGELGTQFPDRSFRPGIFALAAAP